MARFQLEFERVDFEYRQAHHGCVLQLYECIQSFTGEEFVSTRFVHNVNSSIPDSKATLQNIPVSRAGDGGIRVMALHVV